MSNGPYSVVVDSNIWVAERILQTTIGSAFLYALTGSAGKIVLPEIVEREVQLVLLTQSEKAVGDIARAAGLLRHVSGQSLQYSAPTEAAMEKGIAARWAQLEGLLERVEFTLDHAKAALERIYKSVAPCGPNNEQFRDCCIWEIVKAKAQTLPVHFVTGDSAFYESRDPRKGLAKILQEEAIAGRLNIRLHSTLGGFLDSIQAVGPKLDPHELSLAIIPAVAPIVAEKVSQGYAGEQFELTLKSGPVIKGYATPNASTIAVTFEVSYWLRRVSVGVDVVTQDGSNFSIEGTCSYDPNSKIVSDVSAKSWREYIHDEGGFNYGRFEGARGFEMDQQRRIT